MFCGSGGPKSRLAKAAGADPSGQMRDEKLHAAVAKAVKMQKDFIFGALLEVELVRAAAARSTFPSQNVEHGQLRSTCGR